MPIHEVKTGKKHYYQYGSSGKRYYFDPNCLKCKQEAYNKALQQTKAIHAYKRGGNSN
jgi:hypothetical protein